MLRDKLILFIYLVLFNSIIELPNTFAQMINDPLQGSTIGTQVGGTFTSEGYKPGLGLNHILYVVPSQVVNGCLEFEMKGFWPGDFVSSNNDHGFLMMYDARGIGNVPSWDDFRDNYFRWNFHWRQNTSTFKCVVNCAAPTSLRLNSTYAVFIEDINGDGVVDINDRDWYDEPNGSSFTWNSNKTQWYLVKIEWYNKTFKVFVDGNLVWVNHASSPYDYAPIDHRIWLGCGVDKYNSDVSDVVYRNFKLFSYAPTYQAILANDTLINSSNYEFDIYLHRTGDTALELASCQIGLTFDDNIRNGGVLSSSILPGSSQLSNSSQIPDNPTVNNVVGTKRVFQLSPQSTPAPGSGSIISNIMPGTRIGRFRISNTQNFSNIPANISWTFLSTEYQTKISANVGSSTSDITSQPAHLNNLANFPLPVELSSFTIKLNRRDAIIEWITSTEVNTSHFQIERCYVSAISDWTKIGEVLASGNSNSPIRYSYFDGKLNSGKYKYRLKTIDLDGSYKYSDNIEIEIALPTDVSVSQNYPNPFNPTTRIDYQLPTNSKVLIDLYSLTGEKITTLINANHLPGYYSVDFNASRLNLTSGVYIYRYSVLDIVGKNLVISKKLLIAK